MKNDKLEHLIKVKDSIERLEKILFYCHRCWKIGRIKNFSKKPVFNTFYGALSGDLELEVDEVDALIKYFEVKLQGLKDELERS